MSLVIGILVDDSTVVLENIERHFTELGTSRRSRPRSKAARRSARRRSSSRSSTWSSSCRSRSSSGQVGRNLVEFALVVVISTLTSLFVSFTVTPTLAGLWALKSHWKPPIFIDWFTRGFDKVRDWYRARRSPWGLRNGWVVARFCAVVRRRDALVPLGVVGEEFVPTTDRGQIYIQLDVSDRRRPSRRCATALYKLEKKVVDRRRPTSPPKRRPPAAIPRRSAAT
jgi:HAE1 family hydrophobic/amphiphilic exporter-1